MNQQIRLYRYGAGPRLSLLHGWGMNAAIFEPLVESLRTHVEVICVDLPGHGQSGWNQGMEFDTQVDALAEVLPDSNLVGWSMGGLHAIALAKRFPHQFPRLSLLCCNPCFVQQSEWPCGVERAVFDEFSQSLIANWQTTIKRFVGLQLHGSAQARDMIRRITALLVKGGSPHPEALRQGLELLLTHDARDDLAALPQPVLSILGQRDMLVPESLQNYLALINPQIRVECLAHSAHAPFVSHTETVSDLLREFIKSSPAR
jgi:pimeloyl-[acyl-carrier protein] methyl ester esterase